MFNGNSITRRDVLKAGAAGLVLTAANTGWANADDANPVHIGFIGVGRRGKGLLPTLLSLKGVEVPAVCDIDLAAAEFGQKLVVQSGRPRPELYTRGEEDYRRMMDRADLDAVVIAAPWECHTPMSVCGMKAGKYVAVEVPCALTLDECWELVKTSEATGVPCMMLENWSFRRDNLAVLYSDN